MKVNRCLFIVLILSTSCLQCVDPIMPKATRVNFNLQFKVEGKTAIYGFKARIRFDQKITPEFYEHFIKSMEQALGQGKTEIIEDKNEVSFDTSTGQQKIDDKSFQEAVDRAVKDVFESFIKPKKRLRKAIMDNSAEDIKKAIEAGAIINFDDHSKSPLLHAVLSKKEKAVRALLEAGANPNIMYQGKKLIHNLILNKGESTLLFINFGADFSGNIDGQHDLFNYIMGGHSGLWSNLQFYLMDMLIKKGNDIKPFYETTDLSKNLFYQSISNDIAEKKTTIPPSLFFLVHGADKNQIFTRSDGTTITPLMIAVEYCLKNMKETQLDTALGKAGSIFLEYGADINQQAKPILNKGPQNLLSLLLMQYDKSLKYTVKNLLLKEKVNFAEGVRLFIKSGGNPDLKIETPANQNKALIEIAIDRQDKVVVKMLLDAGAKPLGLQEALKKPSTKIIELLIQHGAQ